MAKKNFKDNPALQFISKTEEEPQEKKAEGKDPEAYKKAVKAPEGYKINPVYVETKSKRLQLVLQPSLYDRVKATAKAKGLSVNEFCHQILDEATREERM